jgi:intermediate peptidase
MSIRALKTWATNKHLQRECKNVIPKLFAQKLHSTSTAFKDSAVRQLDLTDSTEKKNDLIKLLFDDASIWRAHQQFNGIDKTGLFENPHFMSVQGFDYATKQAIQRAQIIVERICNAPSNGTDEMRKVVKNLDRLSDTLCSVIDIAEFVRNAHPDPSIMEAANKAYGDLCSYMNMLNTDTRLHEVIYR